MKPFHPALLALAAASLLQATGPAPDELALNFAPADTKIEFTLGDVLHTVHGTFQLVRGGLHFDAATGKAGGELVVDAASGASGSPARDKKMNSEVLESGKFPQIVFRPDHVEGKVALEGPSTVQVHGVFSIHGADHEITIPAEVHAAGGNFTADLHFIIPYQKWGMKNPSVLLLRVGSTVDITIHAVGRRPGTTSAAGALR